MTQRLNSTPAFQDPWAWSIEAVTIAFNFTSPTHPDVGYSHEGSACSPHSSKPVPLSGKGTTSHPEAKAMLFKHTHILLLFVIYPQNYTHQHHMHAHPFVM